MNITPETIKEGIESYNKFIRLLNCAKVDALEELKEKLPDTPSISAFKYLIDSEITKLKNG